MPSPIRLADPSLRRPLAGLVVCVSLYVAASLTANVMSVRIVTLVGFSIDAGTLTYPLTFTLRDLIHKIGGRNLARVTIVVAAACNVLLAFGLWAASKLPADLAVGPQEEFGDVLLSTWRIVAASVIAQVIAEIIDTEIYHRYTAAFGRRFQMGRVLSSNAVSVPVDSVVFTLVAFAGDLPGSVIWSIIWANIVIKGCTSLVSAPLIFAVPEMSGEVSGDPEVSDAARDTRPAEPVDR